MNYEGGNTFTFSPEEQEELRFPAIVVADSPWLDSMLRELKDEYDGIKNDRMQPEHLSNAENGGIGKRLSIYRQRRYCFEGIIKKIDLEKIADIPHFPDSIE